MRKQPSIGDVTLRHTPQGVPYVRLYLGTSPVTGRRIRPYREFPHMSDDAALDAAMSWANEIMGTMSGGVTQTVGEMLSRQIGYMEAAHKSTNTIKTYRLYATRYVAPISTMLVRDVDTDDLDDLFAWLLTVGPEGSPLSPTTVKNVRFFLEGAFGRFARLGIIAHNPVIDTIRPEEVPHEAMALDVASLKMVADALAEATEAKCSTKNEVMRRNAMFAAMLALNTGLRCGEVCGLRRCDVNMTGRFLSVGGTVVESGSKVYRQNKTKGKRLRNVALPEDMLPTLESHMCWLRTRLHTHRTSPLVTADGKYMRPSYVSRQFSKLRDKLGLSRDITFHTLRHTYATTLLEEGMNVRDIQELLGHAYVDTTLSAYGHVLPGRGSTAANRFAQALRRAREG